MSFSTLKRIGATLVMLFIFVITHGQDLKFDTPSNLHVREEKQDKTISIHFVLEKATKDCDISVEVDEQSSSVTKDNDYDLVTKGPFKLKKDNKYAGKVDVLIKSDQFVEMNEELHLVFKYKDEKDKEQKVEYVVIIGDINDGGVDDPQYTDKEKNMLRGLSMDIYTGGNFDFFDGLKFQNIGGEFIIAANNITGKNNRFGGFLGMSNFQNFSFDSSNKNIRREYVRIDTGTYIPGVTKYIRRLYVDHQKVSINQWSYYVNPTYRLKKVQSDFFNIYLSVRLEALRTSTKTEYVRDTISFTDTTNQALGSDRVFQSGSGIPSQKIIDVQTNGFFSIGTPMFLNAKNKFKLYFDPNLGVATYSVPELEYLVPDRSNIKYVTKLKPFYLFRARITEQFSGISITIGGEIRGLFPAVTPTINAYLGLRADIAKWFGKNKTGE